MSDVLPAPTRRLLSLVGPQPDRTQRAMADHARETSFPVVGPAVGGLLTALARLTAAERVVEFGSGFGYSASWFARGMAGGEVVLTEVDADELELARTFLEAGGYAPSFRYEHGDAMELVRALDGPVDLVLVDHRKRDYPETFDLVADDVAPGGAIVADNVMAGPVDLESVLAGLEGGAPPDATTAGVVTYLERARDHDAFTTVALPIGSGVALSVKRR